MSRLERAHARNAGNAKWEDPLGGVNVASDFDASLYRTPAPTKRVRGNTSASSRSTSQSHSQFFFDKKKQDIIAAIGTKGHLADFMSVLQQHQRDEMRQKLGPIRELESQGHRVITASAEVLKSKGPKANYGVYTDNIDNGYAFIERDASDGITDRTLADLHAKDGFHDECNIVRAAAKPEVRAAIGRLAQCQVVANQAVRYVRAVNGPAVPLENPISGPRSLPNGLAGQGVGTAFLDSRYKAGLNEGLLGAFIGRNSGIQPFDAGNDWANMPDHNIHGYENFFPGDNQTHYRVTWEQALQVNVKLLNGGTIMDTAVQYMDFIRELGDLRIVDIPFTLYMQSQEWDPIMMDLDAEEIPYTEGTWRGRSEKRGFTRVGKSIRCTVESLKTRKGRESLVLHAMQIGAGAGAQECYFACAAVREAQFNEEVRRFQDQMGDMFRLDEGIDRLCQQASQWARLHRGTNEASAMLREIEAEYEGRGGSIRSRTQLLIFGRETQGMIQQARGLKGVKKLRVPTMKPDRITEINQWKGFKQIGGFRPIPWHPGHQLYRGAFDPRKGTYDYKKLYILVPRHNGTIEKVTLYDHMMGLVALAKEMTDGNHLPEVTNFFKQMFHCGVDGRDWTLKDAIDAKAQLRFPGDAAAQKTYKESLAEFYGFRHVPDPAAVAAAVAARVPAPASPSFDDVETIWSGMIVVGNAKKCPDPDTWAKWITDNKPLFCNGIHSTPHTMYEMGEVTWFAKAPGSYTHYMTAPLVQAQVNAELRNVSISTRMDSMGSLPDSMSVIGRYATNIIGYRGGDEAGSNWDISCESAALYREICSDSLDDAMLKTDLLRSNFLLVDALGEDVYQRGAMDLTGYFSDVHRINQNGKALYAMHHEYSLLFGWTAETAAAQAPGISLLTTSITGANTLVFRECAHYPIIQDDGKIGKEHWYEQGTGPRSRIIYDPNFRMMASDRLFDDAAIAANIESLKGASVNMLTPALGRTSFATQAPMYARN